MPDQTASTQDRSHLSPVRGHAALRLAPLLGAVLLSACAVRPVALTPAELAPANQADRSAIRRDVEPIRGPLSLEEALARALKYNLDRRSRMLEEALALRQLDVSQQDMLPKLLAQAGYNWRDSDRILRSRNVEDGTLSPSRFISQDREHKTVDLSFSWSLLDLSLGYYGSQQQADRVMIAVERRRKAMHLLMQDVRVAYWRSVSAQKLRDQVKDTIRMAEDALKDARRTESERVRNPLDSLRYQRQLLENLRLLEAIDQELSSATVELASLINAPVDQPLVLAESDTPSTGERAQKLSIALLEETALANNPDLREAHYNARIARIETRRAMVRMFPNINFNYGSRYDTDSYLVKNDWQDAGVQVSYNVFNLLNGPAQMKMAKAGVALADQRRLAMQLAVITQMHLARLQLSNARAQFERADAIFGVDTKIADMVRSREAAQAQSKLEAVSNATTAILSLLRRYQALSQVQLAENRLLANLGMEPQIGSVGELSLAGLVEQLRRQSDPWAAMTANR